MSPDCADFDSRHRNLPRGLVGDFGEEIVQRFLQYMANLGQRTNQSRTMTDMEQFKLFLDRVELLDDVPVVMRARKGQRGHVGWVGSSRVKLT